MLRDLKKSTIHHTKAVFAPLDKYAQYVYWIRSSDMSKQYYQSSNCNTIWQSDMDIIYDLPLIWLDFLVKEEGLSSMRQLSERHENNYLLSEINQVCYQIIAASGELQYLTDQAFRCYSTFGDQYIVGISKHVNANDWDKVDFEEGVYQTFFHILKEEFSIVPFDMQHVHSLEDCRNVISQSKLQDLRLSKRELECLRLFCQGKSYKEAAKILAISPRTMEGHLANIMNKTSCSNKIDVICRYSRYFTTPSVEEILL